MGDVSQLSGGLAIAVTPVQEAPFASQSVSQLLARFGVFVSGGLMVKQARPPAGTGLLTRDCFAAGAAAAVACVAEQQRRTRRAPAMKRESRKGTTGLE
jgi:hypothetical protein